jgi:hypothetical protein
MWSALIAAVLLVPAPDPSAPPPSRIVFASARTGVAQLYSMEPSGAGLAQLTFGAGNWGFPTPSPDGRFVAAFRGPDLWLPYASDLVQAPRPELWLMQADGSGARLVSPNAAGAYWSSDSRRLVFLSAAGDTYTVAAAGGRPHLLNTPYGSSLTPSPDGRSIAFLRPDTFGVVHVVVRRNGHERTVARGLEGRLVWSPNGRWIAIRNRDTLAVVRTSGGVVHVFSAPPNYCIVACVPPGVAWSPDSRRLAFETGNGIELGAPSRAPPTLLIKGLTQGLAWSPRGDAITFTTRSGVGVAALDGHVVDLVSSEPGESLPVIGWAPGSPALRYRAPEDAALLVRVSGRELEARLPIRQLSADGDRVAYWLCPHSLGVWRPGDTQPVALGPATLAACLLPSEPRNPGSTVFDLALAGDRLAYLTAFGGNTTGWELRLTSLDRRDEGVKVDAGSQTTGSSLLPELGDVIGSGPALVYGSRSRFAPDPPRPEAIWRLDGATPVKVAGAPDDLKPLALDGGRIVVRRADGSLELLDLVGDRLRSFDDVAALGAALAGDDLVVLVRGELRDYSASTGDLLDAWPLPDLPSSGRCRDYSCPGIRLTLDDAARGVVVYTLDGVVHLLRLSDGEDKTVPGATVAELTDAGLFYAYVGEEPWPGRIRFVPFDELPL